MTPKSPLGAGQPIFADLLMKYKKPAATAVTEPPTRSFAHLEPGVSSRPTPGPFGHLLDGGRHREAEAASRAVEKDRSAEDAQAQATAERILAAAAKARGKTF